MTSTTCGRHHRCRGGGGEANRRGGCRGGSRGRGGRKEEAWRRVQHLQPCSPTTFPVVAWARSGVGSSRLHPAPRVRRRGRDTAWSIRSRCHPRPSHPMGSVEATRGGGGGGEKRRGTPRHPSRAPPGQRQGKPSDTARGRSRGWRRRSVGLCLPFYRGFRRLPRPTRSPCGLLLRKARWKIGVRMVVVVGPREGGRHGWDTAKAMGILSFFLPIGDHHWGIATAGGWREGRRGGRGGGGGVSRLHHRREKPTRGGGVRLHRTTGHGGEGKRLRVPFFYFPLSFFTMGQERRRQRRPKKGIRGMRCRRGDHGRARSCHGCRASTSPPRRAHVRRLGMGSDHGEAKVQARVRAGGGRRRRLCRKRIGLAVP